MGVLPGVIVHEAGRRSQIYSIASPPLKAVNAGFPHLGAWGALALCPPSSGSASGEPMTHLRFARSVFTFTVLVFAVLFPPLLSDQSTPIQVSHLLLLAGDDTKIGGGPG